MTSSFLSLTMSCRKKSARSCVNCTGLRTLVQLAVSDRKRFAAGSPNLTAIFFAKSISCQWILRLVSQWRHIGVIAIESIDDFPEPGYNPPTRLVLHRRHKITSRLLLMPSFPFCCPVISCFSRVRPKRLAAISVVIPCAIVQRRRGFMRKTHGCESQRQ